MPASPEDYMSAIEALNRLQTRSSGVSPNKEDKLKEMYKFLQRCDISMDKLDQLSVVHVTGTHGKGSTCAYTENILRNHGYRTGFYSSPHLLEVRERIRINGKPISKGEFAQYFWRIYDTLDSQKENKDDMPLYFPFLTVLAFHVFLQSKIDVAIIEVGIGGEYDCTNIIRKTEVVGFTPINFDHTGQLGASVESIAWHKGGVMKGSCSAYTVDQPEEVLKVLMARSRERKCCLKLVETTDYTDGAMLKIPSHVRRTNVSLAIALSSAYIEKDRNKDKNRRGFSRDLALRSIEDTQWPGRYQVKQVDDIRFFLDGAHTEASIRTCSTWFCENTKGSGRHRALIFNLTGPRNPEAFLMGLLCCDFDMAVFTPNVGCRKETVDTTNYKLTTDTQLKQCQEYSRLWAQMATAAGRKSDAVVFSSFSQAFDFLKDSGEHDVLVTGSLYLIGAVLSVLDSTLDGALSD